MKPLVASVAAVIGALLFWVVFDSFLRWVRQVEVELEQ